jgi:hypothetical protein
LYSATVSGTKDGKAVSQTFSVIRYGVSTRSENPMVVGTNGGTYNLTWGAFLGGAWHVDGAGNGRVWINIGPRDVANSSIASEGCVEVCGPGGWNNFNTFINSLGGTSVPITVTFMQAQPPALQQSTRRYRP